MAIGVASMWLLLGQLASRTIRTVYLAQVMDQAQVALHVQSGKHLQLLTNLETALPAYVLTIDREFRDHPGAIAALWMVKAYYERSKIAVPGQIAPILQELPSSPPAACQVRLAQLDAGILATNIPSSTLEIAGGL